MTRIIRYAGVQLPDNTVRLEDGIAGLTERADGSLGTAGVRFDDPDGTDTYTLLQRFEIDETDCVLPRMFTGYAYNVINTRGPFRLDGGRTHDLDIGDLNFLLHLQPARGATAKRPQETGDQRMAWLLASVCLDGIVFDNGLVGSNPNMFDEADYTGAFADEILPDLCVSSSDDIGRIFFVYWDNDEEQPSLFIDLPTATVYTSALRISNDLADVDDISTFAPYISPEVSGDGTEIYCSVFFKYKTGTIFVHNQTTHDTFFSGVGFHRQAVYETSRVGSLATAQRHADQFLAAHSGQRDVITCTVKLPPDKVNLIGQGMLVSCKFTHLPTYDTFTNLRVAGRTVLMTQTTTEYYDVQLELSRIGITPAGGGGTGVFPNPPPTEATTPLIVQQVFQVIDAFGNVTLPSAPSAGNWLVLGVSSRGTSITLPGGWTEHPHGQITPGSDYGRMAYRLVGTGESADVEVVSVGGTHAMLWEVSGIDGTLDTSSFADTDTGTQPASINAGTLTPTASVPAIMFMFLVMHCSDWGGNGPTTMSTPTGWTLDGEYEVTNSGDLHPNVQADSLSTDSTTGSYTTSSTIAGAGFNFGGWGGLALAFQGSAGSGEQNPPVSGQPVLYETVTPDSDGSVTTFTTQHPYADGSLTVYVDRLDQTASVTSFDGECGEFTLSYAPLTGELVEVSYQGR